VPLGALQELRGRIEHGLQDASGVLVWDLDVLLRLDRAEGRQALARALARRERHSAEGRAHLLALAVRHGPGADLDALLRLPASPALLLAGDGKALAHYLKDLDARRSQEGNPFNNRKHLDHRYSGGLRALFPAHAPEFFARVAALLESPHLPERA